MNWDDARLAWRLFWDKRVKFSTKLIPVAAVFYVFSPLDFMPANPIDDIAIVMGAINLFIQNAPPHIVALHRRAMNLEERIRVGEEDVVIIDNDTEEASGGRDENTVDSDFTQL